MSLCKTTFHILRASKNDAREIFHLSNQPLVRKNSTFTSKIDWDKHLKWFLAKIDDVNCIYFVAKDQNDQLIGQVRFDKIENEESAYTISISISKNFRGMGLGFEILVKTTQKLFLEYKAKKIHAYIKEDNTASIKCFLKARYKIIDKISINNKKMSSLLYLKSGLNPPVEGTKT